MFDELQTIFSDHVFGAYLEYAKYRDANITGRHRHLSSALRVASALFHFREHLPDQRRMTWLQVVAACPDYRLIANIANASKHNELTRNDPIGKPLVDAAHQLEETMIVTRFSDERGKYSDTRSHIFANCTDGVRRDLDQAIDNVLNYWGKQLAEWGITKFTPLANSTYPGTEFVPREKARAMDIEILRDGKSNPTFQLLEYDPIEGHGKPPDLKGASFQFNVYKPALTADVSLVPHDGGDPIIASISLSDSETQLFLLLESEAEKEKFVRDLASRHREEFRRQIEHALSVKNKTVAQSADEAGSG